MPKRRNVVDSDDELPESSQASKRARTEDDDELALIPASSPPRERKPIINGKGKSAAQEHDSDEEDEDEDLHLDGQPDEEAETRFEEDHGEAIRHKLELRRSTIGVRGLTYVVGTRSTRSC